MALDALYQGNPVPGAKHLQRERVLDMLRIAGPEGATRKEICRAYGVDGGKISAALTMLHECGVIYPLMGVRR
jgi:predicted transcriptional regulator